MIDVLSPAAAIIKVALPFEPVGITWYNASL
jgi:hypothetical protein